MGIIRFDTTGYENTNYTAVSGIAGIKVPYLPMSIHLKINQAPPPLYLLINPNSMSVGSTKKVTPQKVRANQVTTGYVVQHAFDELEVMNVSGITAMMYHPSLGLTAKSAKTTIGYDQWAKLLALFRNNGVNFNSKEDVIASVGRVAILYDGIEYRGSFDDFSWSTTSESPFNYTFSWTFTVSEKIDSNIYRGYTL